MQNHNQRLLSKALFEQRKKSKLTQKNISRHHGYKRCHVQ